MKTLQNFITEEYKLEYEHEEAGDALENVSAPLYFACCHANSIMQYVEEYKREFGDEDYINWGEYDDYESLTSDAQHALMDGESECEPEYRLMVRCAEAEWKKTRGYWEQLKKELKSFNKTLMKEQE